MTLASPLRSIHKVVEPAKLRIAIAHGDFHALRPLAHGDLFDLPSLDIRIGRVRFAARAGQVAEIVLGQVRHGKPQQRRNVPAVGGVEIALGPIKDQGKAVAFQHDRVSVVLGSSAAPRGAAAR